MSSERDRARLISDYADDLLVRRQSDRRDTESGSDSDLSRMLDLTRTLSELEFELPSETVHEATLVARKTGEAPAAPITRGSYWRQLVAASLVMAVLFGWFAARHDPAVSASELLDASARAEASRVERPGIVAHRAFTIEALRRGAGESLPARHVEVWVNATQGVRARRLFDDQRRLLGGEWTNADGSRVVYAPGKSPRAERAEDPKPLTLDAIWRWEPSATDFSQLAGRVDQVSARESGEGFELSIDEPRAELVQAALTLDADRLPLAQRVILHDANGDVEVRTTRTASEELPAARVAQTSFEPDSALLPGPTLPDATIIASTLPPSAVTAPPPARLTEQELDAVELQAWYRLHALAGCLVQPGELHRRAGQMAIRLVVSSESCRADATSGFARLASTTGVSVELLLKEPQVTATSSMNVAAGDLDDDTALTSIPAYRLLYDYHARQALRDPETGRDVDATVKPLIRRLAIWVRDRSARRVATMGELRRLAERWPPDTLKPLGLDAASMWQSMVRDHARTLATNTELLITQLEPALGVGATSESTNVGAIRNLADVREAIATLDSLVQSEDVDLRRLFEPQKREQTAPIIPDGPRIVESLRRAGRRAFRLTEPWSLEK